MHTQPRKDQATEFKSPLMLYEGLIEGADEGVFNENKDYSNNIFLTKNYSGQRVQIVTS
jgi:hypothetical protein